MVQRDQVFREPVMGRSEFVFDEKVASVFDDMIVRSVPLYRDVQRMLPRLAASLRHDPLKIVDLGCSTGASLISLAKGVKGRRVQLVGVDNSKAMLGQCHQRLNAEGLDGQVELVHSDLCDAHVQDTSMVLMNYTLQFVEPQYRPDLLKKIRQGVSPDGVLVLSEKVHDPDPERNQLWTEMYYQFKRDNGYSELEIARKRDALENVLITHTVDQNSRILTDAGFASVRIALQWFNFVTIIATP